MEDHCGRRSIYCQILIQNHRREANASIIIIKKSYQEYKKLESDDKALPKTVSSVFRNLYDKIYD